MIELSEVLSELRSELDRARKAAEGEELQFGLGPVDLEITVALGREGKAGGKVRFYVAEVGAEGKLTSTSTQRIKLTLQPTAGGGPQPGGPVSAGEAATSPASPVSVYVGGSAVPGER